MFDIYVKDFNKNGKTISTETLIQTIPMGSEDEIKFINAIVKNEMGSAESFEFSIEPGKKFYDAFKQMKTFVRIVYDGTTIFYGRVVTIDNNGFRGTRKIRCEGAFALFLDSPVEGVEETARREITTCEYIKKLIANHNSYMNGEKNKQFILGEVPGQYSSSVSIPQQIKNDSKKYGSDSWTDTKSALEDLRSHYGGYFRTRLKSGIGSGIYLDWMDQYFNKADKIKQSVRVGKNILDINSVTELENIFTAIIPIGRHTVSSSNSTNSSGTTSSKQTNLYLDGKILKVPDIVSKYGDSLNFGHHTKEDYQTAITRYGMIIKTVTFQEANTKEKLYNQACEWIKNNYQGEVLKFTIKAIDMHIIGDNTSPIMVGDRVEIIYPVGNENGVFEQKSIIQTCLSISFDLYHPENNSYTFGVPANILTKTYGVSKQAQSVASNSTTPKPTGGTAASNDPEWINLASGWLMRHHIHYFGTKPWKTSYGDSYENSSEAYLYDPIKMTLASAHSYRYIIDPANPNHEIPIGDANWYLTDPAAKVKWVYDGQKKLVGAISTEWIVSNHVCEWVLQEYGYDLRTQLGVKMPTDVTGIDGEEYEYDETTDPETGLPIYVVTGFDDGHHTEHYTADGHEIISIQDEDGTWHYYYKDDNGIVHETNIRDLSIAEEKTEDKVGWVVTEKTDGSYDLNPDTMPGQLRLTIEKGMDGEYVVARMSGEMMYLGNLSTRYTSICGDNIKFHVNPADENSEQVTFQMFRNGVSTSVTTHETVIKNLLGITGEISVAEGSKTMQNANSIQQVVGKFVTVKDAQGNETLKIISGGGLQIQKDSGTFGLWDSGNLTGGVVIDRINSNTSGDKKINGTRISLKASQVVIDNEDTSSVLSWMEDTGKDISDYKGLITPKVTALEGDVRDLKADSITTKNINTQLASVDHMYLSKSGSYIDCKGYIYGFDFVIGHNNTSSAPTNQYVSNAICDLRVVQSGNTYSIQKKDFKDVDWVSVPDTTFSRAISSFTSTWANGKLTVTASPQSQSTQLGIALAWYQPSGVSQYSRWMQIKDPGNNIIGRIELDNKVKIEADESGPVYGGSGLVDLLVYAEDTIGTGSSAVTKKIKSKVLTIDVNELLEEKTVTLSSTSTVSPSDNHIGLSSVKINVTQTAPHSSNDLSVNDPPVSSISISADGKSTTFKLAREWFRPPNSSSDIRGVKLTDNSNNKVVGRIDIDSGLTLGYDAPTYNATGKISVNIKLDAELNEVSHTIKQSSKTINLSSLMEARTVSPKVTAQTISPGNSKIGLTSVTINAAPLEEKTVTPSTSQQILTPSSGKIGFSKVTVNAAEAGGGTIDLNTGNSSYYGYNLKSIAYALGTSESNLVRIFNNREIGLGMYYGFKVTCGSSTPKYYYFQT